MIEEPKSEWADYGVERTGPPVDRKTLLLLGTVRATGGPDDLCPVRRMAIVRMVDEIIALRDQVAAFSELERLIRGAGKAGKKAESFKSDDPRGGYARFARNRAQIAAFHELYHLIRLAARDPT